MLEAMPEILPADAYALWEVNRHAQSWTIAGSRGLSEEYVRHAVPQTLDDGATLLEPIFVPDVFDSPSTERRRAVYETEGIRAMLVLPLHNRGEAAGSLVCYYRTPRAVDETDMQLVTLLSEVVSLALNVRKFDRFAEAARMVAGELDVHKLVQSVTDAATELTHAQFGAFFYNVLDGKGGSYTLYTISGAPREAFSRFPMPRNTEVFAPTFAGTGIVRSADIRRDPRYGRNAPHHGMPEGHLPVVSYLAVPVVSRSGEVLGGLFFGHADAGVFTENEEVVAEALAAQAAIGIDNARLYDALQRERTQLLRNEARYKSLVLATPSAKAIWIASPDGLATELDAWNDITGQSPEEARGLGWLDALHPDDRARTGESWRSAVETGEPMVQQFRLRQRDGSYRWFISNGVAVERDGKVEEWVGTVIDIHDRKIAEDGVRFLAEASDLFTSTLDYERTLSTLAQLAVPEIADWCAVDIADENGPYRRLAVAHVDPAKVELAHHLRRFFPPDPETDTVAKVIRTGEPFFMEDIPPELVDQSARSPEHREMLRKIGLRSMMVLPLRARGRSLGAVSFVASDSGRRFTHADFSLAQEFARRAAYAIDNARLLREAQAANRTKDEFLATLSHELRTPMTAVLGWARMMKMGLDADETREAIDAIEKSAAVQSQLIEDILDMSRIMSGKMGIETTPVDLRGATEAALSAVHPAAAARGIEVLTSFAPQVPRVLGDGSRLQQVIWNLLTNAIKFTPRGGTVTVRLTSEGSLVRLSVRDSGKGIERSFLPYVFEPFRQQDASTTRAYGGIGLGLAIVRHLVELHGGRIYADSEGEGRGACFTVELPVLESAESFATPRRKIESEPVELTMLDGTRVLVIDDQEYTRDVVAAILRRARATVTTASSVREAFKAIEQETPQVIICDIAMPHEDGYSFLAELRDLPPPISKLPVIALTAFGRPEDRENALKHGFDAYMKKPVEPEELARVVARVR